MVLGILASSMQYMVSDYWLLKFLGFLMVFGMFLNINISSIIERDLLDIWNSQSLAAEYFFYECVLNLVCSKVCVARGVIILTYF